MNNLKILDVENYVDIITGATGEIGSECAKLFSSKGRNVLITGRNTEVLNTICADCHALSSQNGFNNAKVFSYPADLTNPEDVDNLYNYIKSNSLRIRSLINNAGIASISLLQDLSDKDWDEVIGTNLTSAFRMCKRAIPFMLKDKDGRILNISSMWGDEGASCEVAYSASKGGLNAFTKALAKEMGPSHIRINSIAPGLVNTDMNKGFTSEEINEIKEMLPIKKIGEGIDIAKCVKWLIEDEYTTGQIISINGGWNI